jgi:hypothetical protein
MAQLAYAGNWCGKGARGEDGGEFEAVDDGWGAIGPLDQQARGDLAEFFERLPDGGQWR